MTEVQGLQIHITGIVQGVGFRPFVYNLATSLNLSGWISNTSSGVDIEINGSKNALDQFVNLVKNNPPYLAKIDNISVQNVKVAAYSNFSIRESIPLEGEYIPISPDVSICPDCRKELFDPEDRRFRYPFINCTNCGPRFSIIKDIPYDRPLTTMADFTLCDECKTEYSNPLDRRFHAQPIACPVCGPILEFSAGHSTDSGEKALQQARAFLAAGRIIAIKGLGGYHLACDASNLLAVENLRNRKKRSDKPFALMAFNIESIEKYCRVSTYEKDILESPLHPVVLLKKNQRLSSLDHTAPHQNHIGFMLPYTPMHLLLLEPAEEYPDVLVMTSGNISEEPISFVDSDARSRLSGIADGFLTNNRNIHTRIDDSVVRVFENHIYPLRRARGFAPQPLLFPHSLPEILACGAELKNTFALSKDRYIFLSHHIGDLENYETLQSYEQGIDYYRNLFRLSPESIAVDLHPDYLSTKFGIAASEEKKTRLIRVQHHHAHLAACLADNSIKDEIPVIGLIFDGTGYGTDGNIWGGEVLVGNYHSYERRFHLQEAPLPGGDSAIRNPARIALAFLSAANMEWDPDLPPVRALSADELNVLRSQLTHHINSPLTTSMGRLFDAVSSLLGIRHRVTYEGQAAVELENLCDPDELSYYEIALNDKSMGSLSLFSQIVNDLLNAKDIHSISAKFHNGIARLCLDACNKIRLDTSINTVAFSGGVWQNITLLTKTLNILRQAGFETLIHHDIPTNDGGISVGQILVASTTAKG